MVRTDRALAWLETTFIGSALAFCALLLFVNVVLRYVFFASLGWAEELMFTRTAQLLVRVARQRPLDGEEAPDVPD